MKSVFSNISYLLQTKSTFVLFTKQFLGRGVFGPLSNLKILMSKFFYYSLKFCQKISQKSSFQTALTKKAFVSW